MRRRLLILFLACGLAGCGSSPKTRFYTLDAAPSGATRSAASGAPIQVERVILPGQLDRDAFVRRIGPNRIDVSAQDRWAGPLDEMIQRILSADLASRLRPGRVLPPAASAAGDIWTIQLVIGRFSGDSTGKVVLAADWSVSSTRPNGKPIPERSAVLTCPARSGRTEDLVAAMSRCLGVLSDRIAARLGA